MAEKHLLQDMGLEPGQCSIKYSRHGVGDSSGMTIYQDVARQPGQSVLINTKRHGIPATAAVIKHGVADPSGKMEPKAKGAKKRSVWGSGDTQVLLEQWAERAIDLRRAKRNSHIYKDIAAEMGEKFSPAEVHTKISNLTQKYREEKKLIGPSGGSPSNWLYYADVHRIIGTNAVNSAPVMESFLFENSWDTASQALSEVEPTSSPEVEPTSSPEVEPTSPTPSPNSPLSSIENTPAAPSSSGRKRNNLGEIKKSLNHQNDMMESVMADTHKLTDVVVDAITEQNANSKEFLQILKVLVDKI